MLVFTSEPLHAPLEIAGAPRATVHMRSSVAHTDVVVRLCDVDTKGRSRNVCDGIRRVHLPDLPSDSAGVHAVEVAMSPTAHRFDRGHLLRVQIASAAFPRYARNLGTGEPQADATEHVVADQKVHHAPSCPSHITLPAVPDRVATAPQ